MGKGLSLLSSLVILPLLVWPALAQVYGHEYEENAAPIRDGEQPVVPLDTQDPSFNAWRTPLPSYEGQKENREPGLVDPQRFFGQGYMQLPTFLHQPLAFTPEDLAAGEVDVAIMGAFTDMGGGARGASRGPNAVRNSSIYLGYGARQPHMHVMVDPLQDMTVVDYGNAPNDMMSTERTIHAVRSFVRQAAEVQHEDGSRVIPFIIGGDHSLMYPDVAALTDVYGKGNVGVVHFDAHYDAGKYGMGHLINHGMPVYRLIEEGLVEGKNFIQVALRGYYPDEKAFEWMRDNGFRYHTMAEIERRGFDAVMEDVIKEANDGPEYIFVSFDIDTLDPAFVPGTGTPEPGGLMPREVFPIVRRLCAESNVVGFELVELAPLMDPTYVSALNANRVIRECLTGIAMRKQGLTEPHYLSPLTVTHGQGEN
ncbi:agmatinase family protein [Roseibium alexandrii]|uniref:Proclavaminate amidinohydrolase n=1 Tax=Roseibium alexandrii TaxID=388408 RepID=A0A0M6ZWZ9_9HYPH|nr:agmatinase family protein [Roseibium alexandrii]CTQ67269.1 Proclavaminate amidinohydrolase [Roseibium alexandrii]